MSVQRLTIDLPDKVAAYITQTVRPIASDPQSIDRLGDLIKSVSISALNAKIRLNVGAVRAVGTITFASFADADTITINGVVFTGKTSNPGTNEFLVGASNEACANNARAAINASTTAKIPGVVKATRRGTITLSSFVTTDTLTVNGVVFTGKTTPADGSKVEFAIGGSDTLTAANAAKVINDFFGSDAFAVTSAAAVLTFNNDGNLTLAASAHATVASAIVVVNSIIPGTIGNLCTLAISAHGSVSAAALAGGTEGTQTILGPSANVL